MRRFFNPGSLTICGASTSPIRRIQSRKRQSNFRNSQIRGCELFEKLVKGFFEESSRDKKVSYNARARAQLFAAPPFA
jgi:hypothetical protein